MLRIIWGNYVVVVVLITCCLILSCIPIYVKPRYFGLLGAIWSYVCMCRSIFTFQSRFYTFWVLSPSPGEPWASWDPTRRAQGVFLLTYLTKASHQLVGRTWQYIEKYLILIFLITRTVTQNEAWSKEFERYFNALVVSEVETWSYVTNW